MLLSFSTSPAFSFDPIKWQHLEPPVLVPGSQSYLSSCPIPLSRNLILSGTSQVALVVKNLPVMQETQETQLQSLGWEDPLEEVMATHFSILAWEIPWAEKPGGLQSMGLQRVGHDWAANNSLLFFSRTNINENVCMSVSCSHFEDDSWLWLTLSDPGRSSLFVCTSWVCLGAGEVDSVLFLSGFFGGVCTEFSLQFLGRNLPDPVVYLIRVQVDL